MSLHQFVNRLWYEEHPLSSCLLIPLSEAYRAVAALRRRAYVSGILAVHEVPAPVIVVGNITAGGTGKTPLVIWLANFLKRQGYRPGIVGRACGVKISRPQQVHPDSDPAVVGDEALLIAQRTALPVAVAAERYRAAQRLLEDDQCDILICDDGLQHYALGRDMEIAVIDGERRFGNRRYLPAGPLREPVSRLRDCDMRVSKGRAAPGEYLMEYEYGNLHSLDGLRQQAPHSLEGKAVHAIAGLGNPERFFSFLHSRGARVIRHEFPDHYQYKQKDIVFDDDLAVVMTEKDAVKCRDFAGDNHWYLPIDAVLGDAFEHQLTVALKEIADG